MAVRRARRPVSSATTKDRALDPAIAVALRETGGSILHPTTWDPKADFLSRSDLGISIQFSPDFDYGTFRI